MTATTSIYLATPCYGGQCYISFMTGVLELQRACAERGVGLHVDLGGGDALITRARAVMAAKFLQSDATHLLFIDADIGFTADQVFRLIEADRDLIGGVCPLKRIDWNKARQAALDGLKDIQAASVGYVVRFIPNETNSVELDDKGFGPVAYVGTGVMLVKRHVVQAVVEAHPERVAKMRDMAGVDQDQVTMIFDTLIESETGELLSEDYAFCRRWRDLGGQIFADFHSRFTHSGHTTYSGSLIDAVAR
jgi:hypothetical protein